MDETFAAMWGLIIRSMMACCVAEASGYYQRGKELLGRSMTAGGTSIAVALFDQMSAYTHTEGYNRWYF